MKRRDMMLALASAAFLTQAQAQNNAQKPGIKKPLTPPSPSDMRLDRHLLAMMLLLMKRKDPVSGTPTYPMITLVKSSTQTDAARIDPQFGQVDPAVYAQIQTHLNLVAGSPIPAIQSHQQATQSVGKDILTQPYPDNQCPFWASVDTAVKALLA